MVSLFFPAISMIRPMIWARRLLVIIEQAVEKLHFG
jgi:hypothetical protein